MQRQQNYSFYQTSKNSILIVFQGVEESMGKDCTGAWGAERAGSAELLWGFRINITGHVCFSPQENVESPLLPFTIFYCQASFSTSWHQLLMDFLVSRVSLRSLRGSPTCLTQGGVNCVLFAQWWLSLVLDSLQALLFNCSPSRWMWDVHLSCEKPPLGGREAVEPKCVAGGSLSCWELHQSLGLTTDWLADFAQIISPLWAPVFRM